MKLPLLFSIALLVLNAKAGAATPAEIRNAIQAEINQRHPNPPDDFWEKLGPPAIPVIQQMYQESNDVRAKAWLVDGMGHFDDPAITALLKNGITNTNDQIQRKGMLDALIRSQGEDAYDFAEPYLKDKDPHVRLAVAQAMKRYAASDRVNRRLDRFGREEKVAWIKDGLKKEKPAPERMRIRLAGEGDLDQSAPKPSPTPMPEKDWAGEWRGAYLTSAKTGAAVVTLTLLNEKPKKDEPKWKIVLKIPKQAKKELGEKDVDLVYYQTAKAHWLEIRNRKDDSVFVGQKGKKQ